MECVEWADRIGSWNKLNWNGLDVDYIRRKTKETRRRGETEGRI